MMRRPMPDLDGVKSAIARAVDALRPELERVALALHGEPELAYEEHRSAERLASLLSSGGLSVARPYSGIATSFLAELRLSAGPPLPPCPRHDAPPPHR